MIAIPTLTVCEGVVCKGEVCEGVVGKGEVCEGVV